MKDDQDELVWEKEVAQAVKKAEEQCHQMEGRAPWGCQWFEECLASDKVVLYFLCFSNSSKHRLI